MENRNSAQWWKLKVFKDVESFLSNPNNTTETKLSATLLLYQQHFKYLLRQDVLTDNLHDTQVKNQITPQN